MSIPERFEELDAWQVARQLTNEVYRLCRRDPLARDFGLCDQLRRAGVSVMNNLAEGWETLHHAEKQQAYNYARPSCGEVRSMSYVLLDNQFINEGQQQEMLGLCTRTGMLITGLMRSLGRRT